ncbi:MAG TPA: hypothetical protein VGX68_10835 [Thermoanaerobaculia bacterium]|jgi:hypothetical protein|nr:hypothetical protein [Thermoanaerobaculia bacterium]
MRSRAVAAVKDSAAALERLRPLMPQPLRIHLHSARELGAKRTEETDDRPLATGLPLDRLLEGGLPRGRMVEVVGGRSSGRFAAALAVLAAVTGAGEAAALVDLGDGLDPESAAELGIDLARLLWVRPANLPQALASAEALVGGGFPAVVVDLGSPPVRGRNAEAPWLRLARAARAHGCALWIGSPYRISGTAAAAVLRMERTSPAWDQDGACRLLAGITSEVVLEKLRGQGVRRTETLQLRLEDPRVRLGIAPSERSNDEEEILRSATG